MNRRNFIKTLGIGTIGLLTPINCFSNNTEEYEDLELKEVFEYITLEFNNLLNQYDKDILIKKLTEISFTSLPHNIGYNLVSYFNKKYNLQLKYCAIGWHTYTGWLLINNPYIISLFDKKFYNRFYNKQIIIPDIKQNISSKFDKIYFRIIHDPLKLEIGKIVIDSEDDFNTINNGDYYIDITKTGLYTPLLTYKFN